ncbi:ABC transporter permease [Shimia sediminis]|uniref:ABC transporter permease n=1 Tax=Shimia sediminis TaxID=2497945 RepID=UPI000F8D2D65|nr:ABC transporter permease [Shimia sediminis]
MLKLACLSLANRRFSLALTVLAIALSVALILGIERLRDAAREGFASTISGVDLIVGSRGSDLQILLATAYGVGFTSNSLGWETYENLQALPQTEWAVPLAMGDTYRDFPIIGTTEAYFEHFSYGKGQQLTLVDGVGFDGTESAILGAEVARSTGLSVGGTLIAAHGSGPVRSEDHDDHPFTITGILAATGTPVDRMIYVPLSGFALLHVTDKPAADPLEGMMATELTEDDHTNEHDSHDHADEHDTHDHDAHDHDPHDHGATPDQINAVFIGLTSKSQTLSVQRWIAEYEDEPLTAVLPGAALLQLWSITGIAERTLRIVAMAVVVAGILGMLTMLSATLEARRREFAILRAVGATPGKIGALLFVEAALITIAGLLGGVVILYLVQTVSAPILSERVGIDLAPGLPVVSELRLLGVIFAVGVASSLLPALRVYRVTVNDGLNLRL